MFSQYSHDKEGWFLLMQCLAIWTNQLDQKCNLILVEKIVPTLGLYIFDPTLVLTSPAFLGV